jgi:hypothetical protein
LLFLQNNYQLKNIKMKKNNSIFKIVSVAFAILFSTSLIAQKDMVQFLAAGKEDANKLAGYYTQPFLNTFGSNMNNGWYSTAAPLKLGRFTISLGLTGSFIPSDEQSFVINPSEYKTITTTGNQPITAPTMFGEKSSPSGVSVKYNDGNTSISHPLNVPEGSGISISPLPLAQFSIGLIKGTEVMLRVFPKLEVKGYKAGYVGVGIKHDVKQWIPFMGKLPFDLSFIGAYTSASLDIVGGEFLMPDVGVSNPNIMDYTTQGLSFTSKAWNANLIISRKFPILTVFGGVRLSGSKTNFGLIGNYPVTILSNPLNPASKVVSHIIDPITLEGSGTQFGINAGFRVKLGIMAIVSEGTFVPGGYSSASFGLNFGFFN